MTSKTVPFVSVVVATRNRGAMLPAMLTALAVAGDRTAVPWELIVVNNGSTDGTAPVLADFAARVRFPVRLVDEPIPGLSRSRNRGIAAATGEIIAFTDDDCLVAQDWLDVAATAFTEDPTLDLLGGKVLPADPRDAPVSLRLCDEPHFIERFEDLLSNLIGCNVVVRRRILQSIGPFDERLGAGTRSRSAEDLDLFYRLLRAGYRLRYDPRLCLRHAHGRRATAELAALRRGYIRGRGAFYGKYMLRFNREIWTRFAWELHGLLRADDRSAFTVGSLMGGVFSRLISVRGLQ